MKSKHTPGPWRIAGDRLGGIDVDDGHGKTIAVVYLRDPASQESANAQLIADAPDRHDQVIALISGWTVRKVSLYDEEGIEGWQWTDLLGNDYMVVGNWNEMPPWPDSAREVLAAQ